MCWQTGGFEWPEFWRDEWQCWYATLETTVRRTVYLDYNTIEATVSSTMGTILRGTVALPSQMVERTRFRG